MFPASSGNPSRSECAGATHSPVGSIRGPRMNAPVAKLLLDDGTEMSGRAFGAAGSVGGEVVFNTAMTGYVEALTDPSCRVQVQGLVVQSYVDKYSHHAATRSLGAWLEAEGVPGITGIDTRTLTRRLREHGTMKGWLLRAADNPARARNAAETVDMKEVFRLVAPDNVIRYEGGSLKVLLVDAGAKDNMVRSLLKRAATVVRAPWHTDLAPLAAECDGIVIGNGPGDPKDLTPLVTQVRSLLPSCRKPVFGI